MPLNKLTIEERPRLSTVRLNYLLKMSFFLHVVCELDCTLCCWGQLCLSSKTILENIRSELVNIPRPTSKSKKITNVWGRLYTIFNMSRIFSPQWSKNMHFKTDCIARRASFPSQLHRQTWPPVFKDGLTPARPLILAVYGDGEATAAAVNVSPLVGVITEPW